jgi:uncharacterized membrane protein
MPTDMQTNQQRITSIDLVRGFAMLLMALDHVRDYFHITAGTNDPLDLQTTTPALFITRWITHFCAPVFVFLSGTSIYLQGLRKAPRELGIFLIKRGLWLILAECLIISLAWTFNPFYNAIPFQVIWAIGASMVVMGLLIMLRLPFGVLLALGVLLVAGHNLLDIPESAPGFQAGFWWDLLHHGSFNAYEYLPGHYVILVYAFPVWLGVMLLGYGAGLFFTPQTTPEVRRKRLLITGSLLVVIFILLRFFNAYGDPQPWSAQRNLLYSFLSFINTDKYPPSLLYLCMTIGPSLILLALAERWRFGPVIVFGRTAFFYYIVHLYLIHLLAAILYFVKGHGFSEVEKYAEQSPFLFLVPGEGFALPGMYGVWLLVIGLLYPLCSRYDRYKAAHREKWWLSYL